MLKIAISGSTGLIGSRIQELLSDAFEFIPLLQSQVDITNKERVSDFLKDLDFDLFLHLAAYTNVEKAEEEKELAYKVNVEGTKNVLEATLDKSKQFIYISTGYVFDGFNPPYFEDAEPNPLGYYGQTKYEGEQVVGGLGMIVRIDTPYRAAYEARTDFFRTMLNLLKKGKELKLISDIRMTPTFIDDLAMALKHLVLNFSPEIYHIVGADSMSPYKSVLQLVKVFSLDKKLIKQTTAEEFSKGRAKRAKFLDMKSKKNNFYQMRSLEEGLLEIKKQLS